MVKDRAIVTDRKGLVVRVEPDISQVTGGRAYHGGPCRSSIVQNGAIVAHGKDIVVRISPDALQGKGGS